MKNTIIAIGIIALNAPFAAHAGESLTNIKQQYQSIGISVGQRLNTKRPCGPKMVSAEDLAANSNPQNTYGGRYFDCTQNGFKKVRFTSKGGVIEMIDLNFEDSVVLAKTYADLDKLLGAQVTSSRTPNPNEKYYYGRIGSAGFMLSTMPTAKGIWGGLTFILCKGTFINEIVKDQTFQEVCK